MAARLFLLVVYNGSPSASARSTRNGFLAASVSLSSTMSASSIVRATRTSTCRL